MNRERSAFVDRISADCVLALALLHHLLVRESLSLEAIRDFLYSLTDRDLVLEYVPPTDEMFKKLIQFRVDAFDDLNLEQCRAVFLERFVLQCETPIADSGRTLLFLRKR